ncbi:MAG: hypothetical protein KTR16_16770 [Acidiferrobacterales bacterium]|nr:hypothetical protein [Acidiferrobacterales bacterium]
MNSTAKVIVSAFQFSAPRLWKAAIALLIGCSMFGTQVLADDVSRFSATPNVEQAIQSAKETLRSTKEQMQLTRAQKEELQRVERETKTGIQSLLKESRREITGLLGSEERRKIRRWERQTTNRLAATGIDDAEGPGTFIVCVLICELACKDDEHCNCSYCALTLPIPDP